MQWLNDYRTRVVVGCIAAVLLSGGSANADFTFGTPTNLGPTVNSSSDDWVSSISADGLSLYFTSNRTGGYGGTDIWVTTRPTIYEPWDTPVNLGPTVNISAWDSLPSISADGLTLFFVSELPGGYGFLDLFVTKRVTKEDDWGTPVNLGATVNSSTSDSSPSISADGLSLYFSSMRPGGSGLHDVYVTTRAAKEDGWGTPVNLGTTVNSSGHDSTSSISADGLLLFFYYDPDPAEAGGEDIWVTTRPNVGEPWGPPLNPGASLNTAYGEWCPTISPDGLSLYFSDFQSPRPGGVGGEDIWQAPILPVVDLNGDGIVDAEDMCTMVDYWGTDNSLCDIGPMPWGDGIVDVEDLKVLAGHLFEDVDDPTLIAHWPLDEAQGGIAYNNAANCDGTLIGDPVWQPDGGVVAGALQLDGIDDHVSTDPVLNPAEGVFSVVAWVMGGAPGQAVLSQADGVNWLCIDSIEGCLATELANPGRSSVGPMPSQTNITDGNWHRIGFVWDGSYRCLYVDGAEVARDLAPLLGLESADGGLYFGTSSTLAPGTFFSGLIDDVRIYNRALHP
ncbi:MAG: LamG-like jellyroll fold domain-containing protein [Planctomycetota bacterium]|jgi:Tol biopolymer transport system component